LVGVSFGILARLENAVKGKKVLIVIPYPENSRFRFDFLDSKTLFHSQTPVLKLAIKIVTTQTKIRSCMNYRIAIILFIMRKHPQIAEDIGIFEIELPSNDLKMVVFLQFIALELFSKAEVVAMALNEVEVLLADAGGIRRRFVGLANGEGAFDEIVYILHNYERYLINPNYSIIIAFFLMGNILSLATDQLDDPHSTP
jgi:hypothetical protein